MKTAGVYELLGQPSYFVVPLHLWFNCSSRTGGKWIKRINVFASLIPNIPPDRKKKTQNVFSKTVDQCLYLIAKMRDIVPLIFAIDK